MSLFVEFYGLTRGFCYNSLGMNVTHEANFDYQLTTLALAQNTKTKSMLLYQVHVFGLTQSATV